MWTACDSLSRKTVLHTCSDLFKPVQNFSHLFTIVDYLRCSCNGSFSLNFLLAKAVIFRSYVQDLRYPVDVWGAILLKLHVFAQLIESYPTVHGLSSCIEIIMSIPQAAHTTVTMYACQKCHFFALKFRRLSFFSITSYPAEIAYFNSPNRELSNFVLVMKLY